VSITPDILDGRDIARRVQVVDEPVLVEGEPFLAVVSALEEPEVEEGGVEDDPEPVYDVEDEARRALAVLRRVHVDAEDVEEQPDEEHTEPDQRDRTVFRFPPPCEAVVDFFDFYFTSAKFAFVFHALLEPGDETWFVNVS
jgi:hypothetical protein